MTLLFSERDIERTDIIGKAWPRDAETLQSNAVQSLFRRQIEMSFARHSPIQVG